MITYIIYFISFLIFIFLIYNAGKAISRGLQAKQNIKNSEILKKNIESKSNIVSQINELKKLYESGLLSEQEFKRAKKKILEG